jgi:protein-tyrosine phosphatase
MSEQRNNRPNDSVPFSVLFICTANQARSPAAVLLMTRELKTLGLRWNLSAAGTHATPGRLLPESSVKALAEVGLDAEGYRSTLLEPALIEEADLVLTADTQNRRDAASMDAAALGKIFTIRQFARYCSVVQLDSPDRRALGFDLLTGARLARTRFQPVPEAEDDIADPVGKGPRAFRATRDAIESAISAIIRPLAESAVLARTDSPRPRRSTATPAADRIPHRRLERLRRSRPSLGTND